jgi:hypothetical protein
VDVAFREFVGDPLPAVRKIYDFAGMSCTADTERAVAEWHRAHPQHSEGKFEYKLEHYGATEADIERAFAPYLRKYAAYL